MELHVEALFMHDENGRMLRVNVAEHIDAPRFFLGRSPSGVVVRFGATLSDEIADELTELSKEESLDITTRDPVHAADYLKILEQHSPIKGVFHEQAFDFPDALQPTASENVVTITNDNADLLHPDFEEWLADIPISQPFVAVVHDGRVVSLSASVRITPRAHECGIETLPDYRGKGLAQIAATTWAVRVRELESTPLYSTMWDNAASQRVAAKIGCHHFGTDFYVD